MKRFLTLLLAACLASFALQAQNVFYLFPDYAEGEILFQGMSRPAKVKMNIDAIGQRVFYYQEDKLMELTNLDMVRTIKVGERMFLMKDGLLCEALQDQARNDFTLFVNWKFRKVNVGSKGAMGATTQNKVDVLWTNTVTGDEVVGEGRYAEMGEYAMELWKMKGDNTYFFIVDGKQYKAKRLKDLYKQFPAAAKDLKAYVRAENLTLATADDAKKVIGKLVEMMKAKTTTD